MQELTLDAIKAQSRRLRSRINRTPTIRWQTPKKLIHFNSDTEIYLKLELLQLTGTFKLRGALTVIDHLTEDEKTRGVVAGTGGNHGIAVAYAANLSGVGAKIIVPQTINPFRLASIKQAGAEVAFVSHISEVLDEMKRIAASEKRTIMHPFESPYISLGTATLGYEFMQQTKDLDILILPIGGGGLASGVAASAKMLNPQIKVYGVEPEGAQSMKISLSKGVATVLDKRPESIADSLCAPRAEPYSFSLCQKYLDDVAIVTDTEIRRAMKLLVEDLKLVTEPAGAIATAGLLGPLKEECCGKRVGVIVCGSNIDIESFSKLIIDV